MKKFNFISQHPFHWLKTWLMKKILFLFLSSFFLNPVFSQDIRRDTLHTVAKQKNISKKILIPPTPVVPELLLALQKPMTVPKKIDLLYNIAAGYLNKLKIDSALFYTQKIKIISDSAGYETGLAKYYLAKGSALFYRNRGDEVKQSLQQAITIFAKYNNPLFLGISYHQLARQLANTNDYSGAQKLYRRAIPLIAASGDVSRLQWAVHNCGRNFFFTLETDSAAYYLSWAIKLAEQLQNDSKIFNSASMLGQVYLISDKPKDAEQTLRYALAVKPPSADKIQLRSVLANYAEVLISQGKYSLAAKAIKEFDQLNNTLGDVSGKMVEKKLKGNLLYQQGNYKEALHHLQDAYNLRINGELLSHDIMSIAATLGKTEMKAGNLDSAIAHFRNVKRLAAETNYIAGTLEANMLLAEAFQQNRNMDSAYHYFKQYSHLKDSILTFKKEKTILELSAKYETGKKEQAIKILEKETEANSYLLQLQTREIEKQHLEDEKKSQQLALISNQNEISKLDVSQKTLSLDNEKKENEKNQAKLKLLEKETAYQKLYVAKQRQQKNIVYTSIGAILALTGYGLYRYIRRRKLQSQQVVLNERLRISRELHDELGSTLSGIAMYSHLTREQIKTGKTQEVEKSLNNMQQTAGSMVDKLKDIVWLVNPEQDSLQKLMERLEDYAEEMAMLKNTEIKISMPARPSGINLPVESRRNIYLFCKEALNNAVKYSDADLIELTMKELDHKKIEFTISDNGKGFEPTSVKKGNGLLNMRQRAADINGIFSLKSSPGHGTIISLTCKIT
jgi:signal transduction histidine kinase